MFGFFSFPCSIPSSGYKVNSNLICVDNQTWRYVVHFDKVNNSMRPWMSLLPPMLMVVSLLFNKINSNDTS